MKRLQQSHHALGSQVYLTLVLEDTAQSDDLFTELWQEIRLFEATFSRFQPDSELTHVNQQAGEQTEVSPEFVRLAASAQKYAKRTQGLYNPFILPQLQVAGYKGSWPNPDKPVAGTDFSHRRIVKPEKMQLGPDRVRLPTGGALDFGGIGKGYLLDQLSNGLDASGITDYWLSLGGDIMCRGHDVDGKPWRIDIQQADGDGIAATVNNDDGQKMAVATSGITKRKGAGWHHIIDPRTGHPAKTDILTATVMSGSATDADVLAKCAVILGSSDAEPFLRAQAISHYFLQYHGTLGAMATKASGDIKAV